MPCHKCYCDDCVAYFVSANGTPDSPTIPVEDSLATTTTITTSRKRRAEDTFEFGHDDEDDIEEFTFVAPVLTEDDDSEEDPIEEVDLTND